MMNCAEFQELLQQRLDGEPIADSGEMDRHRTTCASCRELEMLASRMTKALKARANLSPSKQLSDQIVSQVLADLDSQQTRRRMVRRALSVSSLAAGLLLAVFLGSSWWGNRYRPNSQGLSTVAQKADQPALGQGPNAPRSAVVASRPPLNLQEAGSTLVALVNRTADETVGQSRVLLPQKVPTPDLTVVDNWQPALSSQAIRDAQDGVAVGFEPVTDSARRAVSLFLRELSPTEMQKQ
jgi:hypothetical protein